MSGGEFNYQESRLADIAERIEDLIHDNPDYPPEVIAKFQETRAALYRAKEMTQRVDYLVSGDDGPETFLRRWKEAGL